jgi:hypothetical protein
MPLIPISTVELSNRGAALTIQLPRYPSVPARPVHDKVGPARDRLRFILDYTGHLKGRSCIDRYRKVSRC